MDPIWYWACSAFLLGMAWTIARAAPEYTRSEWEMLEEGTDPMAARLGAARRALLGATINEHSALRTRRAALFGTLGVLLIASDYLLIGPSPLGIAALVFLLGQLILGSVCQEHGILPDVVTIPLTVAALIFGAIGILPPKGVLWGLLIGGGIPFVATAFFCGMTGRSGMGEGVIKHAAAVGAWTGPAGSLAVLTLASVVGALYWPAVQMVTGRKTRGEVNFGPIYAAVAATIFLLARMPQETLWGIPKIIR